MTYLKKAAILNRPFFVSQIVFLIFTLVSFFLRHEGLSFFDASDFATAIQGWGIPHAPGYPLYVILGKFFYLFTPNPFDAQFWLNIAAAWVACFFLFKTLSANKIAALVAVLFLLAQGLVQQYILIPEVFTLNLSLVAMLIYFHQRFDEELRAKYVFLIGLMYGLGVCHHHFMSLMVPASTFLLIRGFMKSSWVKGIGLFAAGFVLGLLPLGYFFIATSHEPLYTYFSVHNLDELLFVVLRKGYGTFKMTGSGEAVSAWVIFKLIIGGLFKSTFAVGLIGGVMAMPFLWRARKTVSAVAVLSISTIIIFIVAFSVLANFPVGTFEGEHAFLRYLTFPGLLLMYPLAHGWEMLSRKHGQKVFAFAGVIAVVAGAYSFTQMNYSHYSTIDYQVQQAYRTIERVMGPVPDTDVDPQRNRCIVFGLTDPFHFGGRYYNEFQTNYRCYFFSIATVITGQFQARSELRLIQKTLGLDFVYLGKTREVVMMEFFTRALQAGYRIFVMYPGDLDIFQRPDMQVTPVGNILELISPSGKVPLERVVQEHLLYLENIKVLLSELEQAPIQPRAVSDTSVQAPFTNLEIYSKILKFPPEVQMQSDAIRARAKEFLKSVH